MVSLGAVAVSAPNRPTDRRYGGRAVNATATADRAWVSGNQAARILGVKHRSRVAALAEAGRITRREIPGARVLYFRPDVELVARASIRPASEGPAAEPLEAMPCPRTSRA